MGSPKKVILKGKNRNYSVVYAVNPNWEIPLAHFGERIIDAHRALYEESMFRDEILNLGPGSTGEMREELFGIVNLRESQIADTRLYEKAKTYCESMKRGEIFSDWKDETSRRR